MTSEQYAALHHPDCDLLAVSYGGDLLYLRRKIKSCQAGVFVNVEPAFAVRLKIIGERVSQ
jgi:hypothetical protein